MSRIDHYDLKGRRHYARPNQLIICFVFPGAGIAGADSAIGNVAAGSAGGVGSDTDTANQLYSSRQYAQAFKVFLPLAEQGVLEAQDMVGMMYMLGVGTEINYALGTLWLSLAAQQGVDHAAETREKLISEYRQEIIADLKSLR